MGRQISDVKTFIGLNEFSSDRSFWKSLLAEFVGTLLLVLIGCGGGVSGLTKDAQPGVVQIAFAMGLTLATIVQCLSTVSGGHVNPAVTLGLMVTRYISVTRALVYILVQCLGAITGTAILAAVTPPSAHTASFGVTVPNEAISTLHAFAIELLVTSVLVLTVLAVCDSGRKDITGSAALAIGLSVTTCHLFAVPITGSSMNPARSFGPAVITGVWTYHWIYWAGPFCGAIAAAIIFIFIVQVPKNRDEFTPEQSPA